MSIEWFALLAWIAISSMLIGYKLGCLKSEISFRVKCPRCEKELLVHPRTRKVNCVL